MSKAQIESKYGVAIVENGYFNMRGNYVKLYDLYTADGCRWEAGLRTIKAVYEECKEWAEAIINIKKGVTNSGR